jgi:hypothetical protein
LKIIIYKEKVKMIYSDRAKELLDTKSELETETLSLQEEISVLKSEFIDCDVDEVNEKEAIIADMRLEIEGMRNEIEEIDDELKDEIV